MKITIRRTIHEVTEIEIHETQEVTETETQTEDNVAEEVSEEPNAVEEKQLVVRQKRKPKKKYHFLVQVYRKDVVKCGVNVKADDFQELVQSLGQIYAFQWMYPYINDPQASWYLYQYENGKPRGKKLATLNFLEIWREHHATT
jgi:hypothetical protein